MSVEVWDISQRKKRQDLPFDDVRLVACAGGRVALVRVSKAQVVVLSAPTMTVEWKLDCDATALALAPTGDRVAVACRGRPIELYAVGTSSPRLVAPAEIRKAWSMAYSHDGRYVAVGTEGVLRAFAYVWDLATNQVVATLGPHDERFGTPTSHTLPGDREDRPRAVMSVAFVGDDGGVASGSFDGQVRLWPRAGAAWADRPVLLSKHRLGVATLATSRDGHYVASADDVEVNLWSVPKGEHVATVPKPNGKGALGFQAPSLAWSSDRGLFAIGWGNGAVVLQHAPR